MREEKDEKKDEQRLENKEKQITENTENKEKNDNVSIDNKDNDKEIKKDKSEKNGIDKLFSVLKVIWNIFYWLLVVFVLLLLVIVVVQRFSNNSVSVGGLKIYNIVSESMIPKYKIGDILVAKEVAPSTLKVGDDIVYKGEKDDFAGRIVTHQIISIDKTDDGYTIITKGIANELADPTITDKQVQGKIIYKFVVLSAISKVINNLYSMYFVIFIPIAIIIFFNIIRIIKSFQNPDDDDEENEDKPKKQKNKNKK